jgi:hypothetical protein
VLDLVVFMAAVTLNMFRLCVCVCVCARVRACVCGGVLCVVGHNTLHRHLHLMGLTDSPLCRKCGAEEETFAHTLCLCEALTSTRHVYLGSFFLEPEDIKSQNLGAIWRFSKVAGLP